MDNYREMIERRVAQFTTYLKLMHHRAHVEGHGSCFIIFEENLPSSQEGDNLDEAEVLVAALEAGEATGANTPDQPTPVDPLRPNDGPANRFIQFSFERHWFCMDMPNVTLFRPEGEKIMRERSGFFYLADLPRFTLCGEDVEGYDPFRKVYLYGDERSAAEDMAYVFFKVWKFPVDWRFYVTASAFGDGPKFERGKPLG